MPEYVVSRDGRKGAAQTTADPFATVEKSVDVLAPGEILVVRGGSYPESVDVAGKHLALEAPIRIQSISK